MTPQKNFSPCQDEISPDETVLEVFDDEGTAETFLAEHSDNHREFDRLEVRPVLGYFKGERHARTAYCVIGSFSTVVGYVED